MHYAVPCILCLSTGLSSTSSHRCASGQARTAQIPVIPLCSVTLPSSGQNWRNWIKSLECQVEAKRRKKAERRRKGSRTGGVREEKGLMQKLLSLSELAKLKPWSQKYLQQSLFHKKPGVVKVSILTFPDLQGLRLLKGIAMYQDVSALYKQFMDVAVAVCSFCRKAGRKPEVLGHFVTMFSHVTQPLQSWIPPVCCNDIGSELAAKISIPIICDFCLL